MPTPPPFHVPDMSGAPKHSTQAVLSAVVDLAARSKPTVAAASVTMLRGDEPTTFVATGDLATELDESQYERGHGPCLDAIRLGDVMYVLDSRTETRWPGFSEAAVQHGALSSLSLPIPVTADLAAGLNVYATEPNAFSDADRAGLSSLVDFAGMAIANLQMVETTQTLVEQMQAAMHSRAVIDQARGILMARHRCDPDAAFAMLREASQHSNRKLRDIAAEIVAQATRD
jgi:GAF domain-containing protein